MSVGDIAKEVELLRKSREGLSTQSEKAESPEPEVDVDPLVETYSAPAVNHSIPTRPLPDAQTGESDAAEASLKDKSAENDLDSSLNATQGELNFAYREFTGTAVALTRLARRKVPAGSRWADAATEAQVEANEGKVQEPVEQKASETQPEQATAGANLADEGSTTEATPPPAPSYTHIQSQQPVERLGVDDSGDWRFTFLPSNQSALRVVSPRVRSLSIRLSRESRRTTKKQSPYSVSWVLTTRLHNLLATDDDSQRMDLSVSTFGPFSTAIIFSSGEVDMVLLDKFWWRCSRDGNIYTVREQVGPDSV